MKFGLLVPREFADHYRQSTFEISGLLQWARVLGGDVVTLTDDLSPYDTIMTNVSSTETEYISFIRQVNPDCKIVAVFDYGFDIVNSYFLPGFQQRIAQVMSRADHIFSVNRNQVEWMRLLVPDKTIHYIPHPSDIENVRKYRKKIEERNLGIAVMWHQYDNYQIQPLLILKAVERKLKRTLNKCLIGLKSGKMLEMGISTVSSTMPIIGNDHPDEKLRGQPLDPVLPKVVTQAPPGVGWDALLPYLGVDGWYHFLSQYQFCLDLYTVNSIGRFGIDCAGVGVPCIASEKSDSAEKLWSFTTVNPFEPQRIIQFVTKLISDSDFYARTVKTADKNLEFYGFPASKARMMKMLGEDKS